MFAAMLKGRGKVKVLSALGVQRIKQICAELDQGGDFKCDKVHGTGATGTVRTPLSIDTLSHSAATSKRHACRHLL